jgi:hypothetical protein
VTRIPKIVALFAFLIAAGCRDSYPNNVQPLTNFYFPVGLAVRQVPASTAAPYGASQLVVVNSNFDLRYDEQSGGSVMVVDPDKSKDTLDPNAPGQLAVLGALGIASFGGEVAIVEKTCPPGWPDCPNACPTLTTDPTINSGGAKVVLASRSALTLYQMSMGADGSLQCGTGCGYQFPVDRLDPYGVSIACSDAAGLPASYAFITHLQQSNGLGWLSRANLAVPGDVLGLVVGTNSSYATVYDSQSSLVFISAAVSANAEFRWFNPLVEPTLVGGYPVPSLARPFFSAFLPGALARDMALSSDGRLLYVTIQVYDLQLAINSGLIFTQGGALAIFDLSQSALAQPRLDLVGVRRTCQGSGQIRRLPTRAGKPDLFAITCDTEGALAIYDSDARDVVRYVGLDPQTGLPSLGIQPFGLAAEPIDPRRATVPVPVQNSPYTKSPCTVGKDCQRIYVGSFYDDWVNVLELDPDQPATIALVKRIGSSQ